VPQSTERAWQAVREKNRQRLHRRQSKLRRAQAAAPQTSERPSQSICSGAADCIANTAGHSQQTGTCETTKNDNQSADSGSADVRSADSKLQQRCRRRQREHGKALSADRGATSEERMEQLRRRQNHRVTTSTVASQTTERTRQGAICRSTDARAQETKCMQRLHRRQSYCIKVSSKASQTTERAQLDAAGNHSGNSKAQEPKRMQRSLQASERPRPGIFCDAADNRENVHDSCQPLGTLQSTGIRVQAAAPQTSWRPHQSI
jgi:hypothetical protein